MDQDTQIGISRNNVGDTVVIRLFGRLDASAAPIVKAELEAGAEGERDRVIVDMSGVPFMDSSGIGALLMGQRCLQKKGRRMELASVTDKVRRVLELTRLDKVFRIQETPDVAGESE